MSIAVLTRNKTIWQLEEIRFLRSKEGKKGRKKGGRKEGGREQEKEGGT